jgi:hypothetical protein
MPEIRKAVAFDGTCTVFVGDQVVIEPLSEVEAEALIASLRKVMPAADQKRRSRPVGPKRS